MKLELAKKQLLEQHPKMSEKVKENVFKALGILSNILDEFDSNHIEKIYQIEKINPSYFPRLSIAASNTILTLRRANIKLPLEVILDNVQKLAGRGRPWESLAAFSSFATHCRSEINEENIKLLMEVNSNIIEIVGSNINNEMRKKSETMTGKFLSFLNSTPLQYDKGLMNSVKKENQQFYPHSSLKF